MTATPVVEPITVRGTRAAVMLGVSLAQIERLAADGHLPRIKIGRATVYRVADLRALADRFADDPQAGRSCSRRRSRNGK